MTISTASTKNLPKSYRDTPSGRQHKCGGRCGLWLPANDLLFNSKVTRALDNYMNEMANGLDPRLTDPLDWALIDLDQEDSN